MDKPSSEQQTEISKTGIPSSDPRPFLKRAAALLEARAKNLGGVKWFKVEDLTDVFSSSRSRMDEKRAEWIAMMQPEIGYWLAKILRDEISIVNAALKMEIPDFEIPRTPAAEIARLIAPREDWRCPTCQMGSRETKDMVCQTCGRDYMEIPG